jgi:hypothetical protein
LLLAWAATAAQAADNYLKIIPSTALAWGVVNHMDEANDKFQKLGTIVQAPLPNPLELFKTRFGITKGLDEKGAAGGFGIAGKTEKDPSVGAFFFAVTDEKAFLGNFKVVKAGDKINEVKVDSKNPDGSDLSETLCLSFRNGYALIAPPSDRAAIEASWDAKQDISAEMAGLESWLAENDATWVGTAAGIKYAAKAIGEELKKSKDSLAQGPDAAVLSSVFGFYGSILEVAPKEVSVAAAGIRCDKQGSVRIIGRARLVNGGQISKAVAEIPPVKQNLLSGLPGGPFAFAAAGVGVPGLADGYMNLVGGLMKSMPSVYGLSPEDLEKMSKESVDAMRQVRSMSMVMKTGKRGDPIFSNVFSVMQVENSQQLLDLQEKSAANNSKILQNAKEGILKSMTVKRLEIAGKPALQYELTYDVSKMAGPDPDASRTVLEPMLGIGGKLLFYYVAADEHTVLMGAGVSQERMVAALDVLKQPKKGLAEDPDVAATAAMLPADAQWVAYMSPRGYMQLIQRVMTATVKSTNPDVEVPTLPEFPKCPPVGFALQATPAELHAEIAVPSSLVQAAGEYVKDLQKMNGGPGQNQPPPP